MRDRALALAAKAQEVAELLPPAPGPAQAAADLWEDAAARLDAVGGRARPLPATYTVVL